ncbi:hypothetical protein Tco_1560281, partial [Tanacetum coccineum]
MSYPYHESKSFVMGSLDSLAIDGPSLGILVIDGPLLETPLLSSELSAMSVLVDACSLAFDPHASTLANMHALAFSMSFQEGFTSLSLHPDFEPQNLPLSLLPGSDGNPLDLYPGGRG